MNQLCPERSSCPQRKGIGALSAVSLVLLSVLIGAVFSAEYHIQVRIDDHAKNA
ncbi:MAG: hypothetical protein LBL67_01895 [Coriobacteriales bacterium]|nr:hypothetical protein [Coriobacteriales bacterium]